MINENWTRWIVASIHKRMMELIKPRIPLFIEGTGWNKLQLPETHVELRLTGPAYSDPDPGNYEVGVYVSLLLTCPVGKNPLDYATFTGFLQNCLSQPIPVFRIGSQNPVDTGGTFGGLHEDPKFYKVETYDMQQIGESVNLRQVVVENHFRMFIDENGIPSEIC